MFLRTKSSVHKGRTYEYLQLVEGHREGAKVRQRVVANLGRKDELIASGKLDAIVRSMAAFSEKLGVVGAGEGRVSHPDTRAVRSWGPALVFERLWKEQGLPEVIEGLLAGRRFGFDVERAVFALALQRLCAPGSDRQGLHWLHTVACDGFVGLQLQHLYRAVGFLGEVREELEARLFERDHPGKSEVGLMFIDTTSVYVHRSEPTTLRKRGYSRDRRPELVQVVLCVAVDIRGRPVAWDILPGNTSDKTAFVAMVAKMRDRFHVTRCTVVADRGMISSSTVKLLEDHADAPFDFILGCRMRSQAEVRDDVLSRAGRYQSLDDNLEVKEVLVGDRRYVVCRNPSEVKKDALDREAIVAELERKLASEGPKSLVGNKGYARFLAGKKGGWSIDREAVAADARLDGKWVLRTNTDLATADVAWAYKSLWRVERAFRTEKSVLEVRPVFHHRDDTTTGHIVASFLALRLEVQLQERLADLQVDDPWPDLMHDLEQVRAVDVAVDGTLYRTRPPLTRGAHAMFAAARVRVPPPSTPLGPAGPRPPDERV